jgi:hypothetical protein
MKARTLPGWLFGMALAGGMVASGLARDGVKFWPTAAASGQTGTAASSTAAVASTAPATTAPAASTAAPGAPTAPNTAEAPSLPLGTHVSPWLYEIQRFAQAGVDEGVILSYVANSAGTFNLTADQVIYLKNLGVSPQVISAMIQHDQELLSGERPMPTAAPPPAPPAVQAALAAQLPAPAKPATPPARAAAPSLPPSDPQIIADDDFGSPNWILVSPDEVPEQPSNVGPVRVPYAVKLNDPIVVLTLPSFTVPCY